jgi:uncharacterized protein (UPF0332 family)
LTPEAERYLAKARLILDHARTMLTVNLTEDAGRAAYLAGFHAAQALISETTGRAVKRHAGVKSEFHRLVRSDPRVDDKLRAFLGFAYDLKAIADYQTGPDAKVSLELATEAIETADIFIAKMAELIEAGVIRPAD